MSTLVAQTISNGTVSTSTANVINGAKAWVNFNGTGTVAIRSSYNVSSITDNGTGDYTINFTNAFADANYAWSYSMQYDRGTVGTETIYVTTKNGAASQSTTALRLTCNVSSGTTYDCAVVTAAIFR
jgi:hypothetical protein